MVKMTKKQKALNDKRISRLYAQRCSGVQVPMMDLPKVFKVAEAGITAGMDDQQLGDVIVAYVNEIRVN